MGSVRISHALVVALIPGLPACGSDTDLVPAQVGTFQATLIAVNAAPGAAIPSGTAQVVVRSGNTIAFTVSAAGLDPVAHAIFLRQGDSCPTSAQDVNKDGVVDIDEGLVAYGPVLLPVDSSLTNGKMNLATFPASASFTYSQSAQLNQVATALVPPSQDPIVQPLAAGDSLNLADRVITVHGALTAVPLTATGAPGLTASLALPVLCGRLQQVQ